MKTLFDQKTMSLVLLAPANLAVRVSLKLKKANIRLCKRFQWKKHYFDFILGDMLDWRQKVPPMKFQENRVFLTPDCAGLKKKCAVSAQFRMECVDGVSDMKSMQFQPNLKTFFINCAARWPGNVICADLHKSVLLCSDSIHVCVLKWFGLKQRPFCADCANFCTILAGFSPICAERCNLVPHVGTICTCSGPGFALTIGIAWYWRYTPLYTSLRAQFPILPRSGRGPTGFWERIHGSRGALHMYM